MLLLSTETKFQHEELGTTACLELWIKFLKLPAGDRELYKFFFNTQGSFCRQEASLYKQKESEFFANCGTKYSSSSCVLLVFWLLHYQSFLISVLQCTVPVKSIQPKGLLLSPTVWLV